MNRYGTQRQRRPAVRLGQVGRRTVYSGTTGNAQHIQADNPLQAGTTEDSQAPIVRKLNRIRFTVFLPDGLDAAEIDWS